MKEKLFKVIGNNQKNPFRGDGEICNCLPASMGMGGGYVPYLFFSYEGDEEVRKDGFRKEEKSNI